MKSKIYFISDGMYIKIGKANNVAKRIEQLQFGNARLLITVGCMYGGIKKEKELHKMFKQHHISGEWFRSVSEIISFAKMNNVEGLYNSDLTEYQNQKKRYLKNYRQKNYFKEYSNEYMKEYRQNPSYKKYNREYMKIYRKTRR